MTAGTMIVLGIVILVIAGAVISLVRGQAAQGNETPQPHGEP